MIILYIEKFIFFIEKFEVDIMVKKKAKKKVTKKKVTKKKKATKKKKTTKKKKR